MAETAALKDARALISESDFKAASIGSPSEWPASLRTIISLMMESRFPMFVAWGPELAFIYNDAYAPILGAKHPSAMGRPFNQVWSEIWDDIGPLAKRALAGEASWLEDLPLLMRRHGFDEQTWFTFSYSPALDESGSVAGVFCTCTETTEKVLAVRRNIAERHRLEQLFGQAPAFMALLTGPEHIFELANDAYMQLVGHRGILGKTAREALPEVEGQGFFELLDGVYRTAKPFIGHQLPIKLQRVAGGHEEQAYVDFVYQPIRDSNEEVTGIFVTGYDVTALRVAQDRLTFAQQAGRVGSFELYPEDRTVELSEEFCRIWGVPFRGTESLDEILKAVHPDDLDRLVTTRSDVGNSSLGYVEYRIRRQDTGEERWIARRGQSVSDGGRIRLAGVIYDITDRKMAEQALAAHARRLETLNRTGAILSGELNHESIVQQVTQAGVDLIGAEFGAFFYNVRDERGELLTLYSLAGADRSQFDQFGHPRATPIFKPTFDGLGPVRSEDITKDERYGKNPPYNGMPEGHLPVRSYLAVPVRSRSGEVLGGLFFGHKDEALFTSEHEALITGIAAQAAIALDNARLFEEAQQEIDRRRDAENYQRLLINELNHRVKNTLAIVQSLAQQSFKAGTNPQEGQSSFGARLRALAAAHNLLTRQNWAEAPLSETVNSAVAATVSSPDRVLIEGPDVLLPPQTAVSLAMAIHELCTNAIKYGSLSDERGKVAIIWEIQEGEPSMLHLKWIESGGPPVDPPASKGFGTRLIQRGLASELRGKVELDFKPHGLVCTIDAPVPTA